jgi:hypothetical protein
MTDDANPPDANTREAAASTANTVSETPALKAATDPINVATKAAADAAAAAAAAKTTASKIASAAADAAANAEADAAAKSATGADKPVSPTLVAAPVSTSYFDLLKSVVSDTKLSGEDKKLLLLKLKTVSPTSDRLTYRTAIWILGFIAVVTILAIWDLAYLGGSNAKVPDGLIAIASGAVGGLAGLLSPSRSSDSHTP